MEKTWWPRFPDDGAQSREATSGMKEWALLSGMTEV